VLNDQLNLASQILNLETLYERSLSDRLFNKKPRLQTVLGFQISITPPRGCENSVAVVEIAVRMKSKNADQHQRGEVDPGSAPAAQAAANGHAPTGDNDNRVSLVALIPHEKNYNAQTVSSSSNSIGGSAVASVLTLGLTSKGEHRQLFIHRDSDTIAFERDPRSEPTLFTNDSTATVFGWEFRPVLGRRTVSPGTRQMLAVIAMPAEDNESETEVTLEIAARSYWRRFDRKRQTTGSKLGFLVFNVDQSNKKDFPRQTLTVPNTARTQNALAPVVKEIKWVNSGADRATVIVKGENFFSGTKVIIGGQVHREEDGNLILKSNQAFELETSISSLATGDAVLSGRFGASSQLIVPQHEKIKSLAIVKASLKPYRYTKTFRLSIEVMGYDKDGSPTDFTFNDLQKLPEPILFIGGDPVPMPYDYYDSEETSAAESGTGTATGTGTGSGTGADSGTGTGTGTGTGSGAAQGTSKFVRVATWIPAKTLAKSSSVAFRVPFCGVDYQTAQPLSFSEPTITRMGMSDDYTIFRISHPLGLSGEVTVELDSNLSVSTPAPGQQPAAVPPLPPAVVPLPPAVLTSSGKSDLQLKVLTKLASRYQNLVVRIRDAEPYLLAIPPEEKPKPKTTVNADTAPPQLKKGTAGPLQWSGTALDAITRVLLYPAGTQSGAPSPAPVDAQFAVFQGGEQIQVFFKEENINALGRAAVEFQVTPTETIRASFFIVNQGP